MSVEAAVSSIENDYRNFRADWSKRGALVMDSSPLRSLITPQAVKGIRADRGTGKTLAEIPPALKHDS